MNRKVFKSMLTLCIAFLAFCYIMKFFFPQEFVMAISNDRIIAIGDFIDSHSWLYYICCGITAFVTHYLYCGACAERIVLRWRDVGIIVATIVIVRALSFVDNNLATAIDFAAFVFIPYLTGGKIKNAAVVYTTHCLAQNLSLSIRNLPQYLTNVNFTIAVCITFEMYLWLTLFFVYFNYKKEN